MLLGALASCTGNNRPEGSDTDESTANLITLFEKEKETAYTVIYADTVFDTVAASAASTLAYNISETYKIDIRCKSESEMRGKVTEFEILAGNTSRPESAEAKKLLKGVENEYLIKLFDNGKLVFVATNNKSLREGLVYFATKVVMDGDPNKLALEKGYEYYKDLGATVKAKWQIHEIPEYTAGTLASNVYSIGGGIDSNGNNVGKMHTVSETTLQEFDAYVTTLKSSGFTEIASNEINGNKFVELQNNTSKKLAYVYYVPSYGEARIILDNASCPETEFEYTYTPKAGETAGIYQFAMMYDPAAGGRAENSEGKYPNNGAFHIIRLSDNSVILIDGGGPEQATEAATSELLKFLYEITGTPAGEKIRVACWYLTHGHGDHFYFAYNLFKNHSDKIELQRVMNNLTDVNPTTDLAKTFEAIKTNYPNAKYMKIHTGQKIQIGDVTAEVLLTHETLTHPETNSTYIVDYNDTSDIIKFTINGKTFMTLGDWGGQYTVPTNKKELAAYEKNERKFLSMYRAADGTYPALKADIVQVAHHAINSWMENVYAAIEADYAFIPQADCEYKKYNGACFRAIIDQLRKYGMEDKNMYHANRLTHWLIIEQNGNITHGSQTLTGADEGYWDYVNKFKPFYDPSATT